MKIELEIPKEIEVDFVSDKFKDFFKRVEADISDGVLCGNYEKEIVESLMKAFDNAKEITPSILVKENDDNELEM